MLDPAFKAATSLQPERTEGGAGAASQDPAGRLSFTLETPTIAIAAALRLRCEPKPGTL